jgi:transcription initiation factor TFIIB
LLFRVTDDAKLFKGKSQDAIIAGCIFIACRNHGQQRSFREIFKMTNVSKKEVGRSKSCFSNYTWDISDA